MRNAFAEILTRLGAADRRVMLLSGDIGNRLFEPFKARCPGRFLNCGVAESNMIGVAAGLALQGLRPVCYTIAPFLVYRALEQIRIDLAYHCQPVVLVGTGGGLAYAELGATHEASEEMGMLRLLPHLQVAAPADAAELEALLEAALESPAPTYLRIGKKGEPKIHPVKPSLKPGQGLTLLEGAQVALLATGPILANALAAARLLHERGLNITVASLPSIKPLDTQLLNELQPQHRIFATLEEHHRAGGLGGAVAEWLGGQSGCTRLLRLGCADEFIQRCAGQTEAQARSGLDPEGIAARIQKVLSQKSWD